MILPYVGIAFYSVTLCGLEALLPCLTCPIAIAENFDAGSLILEIKDLHADFTSLNDKVSIHMGRGDLPFKFLDMLTQLQQGTLSGNIHQCMFNDIRALESKLHEAIVINRSAPDDPWTQWRFPFSIVEVAYDSNAQIKERRTAVIKDIEQVVASARKLEIKAQPIIEKSLKYLTPEYFSWEETKLNYFNNRMKVDPVYMDFVRKQYGVGNYGEINRIPGSTTLNALSEVPEERQPLFLQPVELG
tara:strand:- start:4621 stop:5355 length:735 start_codon:yes stop_codon:yes gene_type:complete